MGLKSRRIIRHPTLKGLTHRFICPRTQHNSSSLKPWDHMWRSHLLICKCLWMWQRGQVTIGILFMKRGVGGHHFCILPLLCRCQYLWALFLQFSSNLLLPVSVPWTHTTIASSLKLVGKCPTSTLLPWLHQSQHSHSAHIRECFLSPCFWWPGRIVFLGSTGLKQLER